jgi:hypothetical protein
MATIHLPPDFKEFLRLLTSNQFEYLLKDLDDLEHLP